MYAAGECRCLVVDNAADISFAEILVELCRCDFFFREEVERAVDGAESADAVENVVVDIAVVAHSGHVLLRLTEQAEVEAAVHIIVVCALALVVDHVHHRVHRDLSHP